MKFAKKSDIFILIIIFIIIFYVYNFFLAGLRQAQVYLKGKIILEIRKESAQYIQRRRRVLDEC